MLGCNVAQQSHTAAKARAAVDAAQRLRDVLRMCVVRAPAPLAVEPGHRSVFLAGAIAGPWRTLIAEALRDTRVTLWDPRREDWDSTWDESADDPRFRAQAEWELEAQERADLIAMYLSPESEAPISLLEFGLSAKSGKVIVCCPDGFWCKPAVDVVCRRYDLTVVSDLAAMIATIARGAGSTGGTSSTVHTTSR